jgi:cyclic beta-1,2-glucan synthetase
MMEVDETAVAPTEAERQLEQTAHHLAEQHKIHYPPPQKIHSLLDRLSLLENWLNDVHTHYGQTADPELALSYAAEWLLDNFYIIQQGFLQIEQDLPEGYYKQLPLLSGDDELANSPRVYSLARSYIQHEQYQVHISRLKRFVNAYQQTKTLTMGELWALPIMLRFTLIENLALAFDRLTDIPNRTPEEEAQLAARIPSYKHHNNDNDIVAYTIAALRQLNSHDWQQFFEQTSLVDQKLRQDPTNVYACMDFDSRDRYRKIIEKMAKNGSHDEIAIAEAAIRLAQQQRSQNGLASDKMVLDERQAHVGYYLLDYGRSQLEEALNIQSEGRQKVGRFMRAHATPLYLGSIALLTGTIIGLFAWYAFATGTLSLMILAGCLMLVPSLTIAVSLINWLVTHIVSPRVLPKLDFEEGIPNDCRAVVVIPGLIAHKSDIDSLFTQLEMHYRRNPDPNLRFALLTDFADADEEQRPEDEELLEQARTRLQELNETYDEQPFYFFHRRRLWNPAADKWMGYERKRGKLH